MKDYIKVAVLVQDFSFQLHFWSLYSKSPYRATEFGRGSLEARVIFNELVEYTQAKYGKSIDFTGYAFRPEVYKTSYFTDLDRKIRELAENSTDELQGFCWDFMRVYNTIRSRAVNT